MKTKTAVMLEYLTAVQGKVVSCIALMMICHILWIHVKLRHVFLY